MAVVVVLALLAVAALVLALAGPLRVGAGQPLADRLRDAVDVGAIMRDLGSLQEIANDNGGIRAGGTRGQMASAAFVAEQLRSAGYVVQVDTFDLPLFTEVGEPTVTAGGVTYRSGTDFRPMIFSASGRFTAALTAVGFDPAADPTVASPGCSDGAFDEVPAGSVILVQGGGCASRDIVDRATAAGAGGLIISSRSWGTGSVLRPTLRSPDVAIPVLGTSVQMGAALDSVAEAGGEVTLDVQTAIVNRPSANVVAETPGGDPDHVVMLGGHLDSVIDGPGINDNGSGTMTVLEIARQAIRLSPERKVRVAFWTGEEIGLYGSFRYISTSSFEELHAIEAYLNFDMLGSPNGGRIVYDDAGAHSGSSALRDAFERYLEDEGLTYETEDLGGSSDHFAFQRGNVPTGGLFSGANETMSGAEAVLFDGQADAPFDACYHLACDTVDNVNRDLLQEMARAAAYVTGMLASGELSAR